MRATAARQTGQRAERRTRRHSYPHAAVADSVEARADACFAKLEEEVRRTGKPVQAYPQLGPPILDDDD